MRKLLFLCLSIALISGLYLVTLNTYKFIKGEDVTMYTRFFETDSAGQHFNCLGILSPVQTESQKIVNDTTQFTHRVIYPYGRNFECVAPEDSATENFVAEEIVRVINDSLQKISFNTSLDYDGKSLAVRKSANPTTRETTDPNVIISLVGTASPEARKYGFKKSIMPGHYEAENDTLARKRLERTADILANKGFVASATSYTELQFGDSTSALMALKNPAVLDSLRWVEADVVITTERLEITPATAPILFPLWLWLLSLGLLSLRNLRLPKMQRPKTNANAWGKWTWGGIWDFIEIILWCILVSAFIASILMLNWQWLLLILLLLSLIVFSFAVYVLPRHIGEIKNAVLSFFRKVWQWARYWWRRLLVCWRCLTPCWKRVFVALLIYAVVMTALVIYLY